ncbi:MAG TPA: CHRD domain-containing protein [Longimicrobiaceae bacterium]|nr:CHRD domain-containing protein [Longimicrobiaceae bacterium]
MRAGAVRSSLLIALIGSVMAAGCTGETGPEGPGGPTGPAGPTGPQGPPGQSGVERFSATLTGASEVPAVTTSATGSAAFTLAGGLLLFRLDVANISNVTAAHIHGPAGAGTNAAVRVDLYIPPSGTPFRGTGTLAQGVAPAPRVISLDSVMVLMRNGNAYVNVHTTANPGGEIRGQVVR